MRRLGVGVSLLALSLVGGLSVKAHAASGDGQDTGGISPVIIKETDRHAPADFGFGPGVRPGAKARAAQTAITPLAAGVVPTGGANAQTQGVFGPPITWPIIGVHAVLLPDGRVLTYGTDEQGQQGGQFVYDVWDPAHGTEADSHLTLPNTTATDIFCSAQSVLSATGQVLITGGDATVDGVRNYSTEQTELFDPLNNTLQSIPGMTYARWYPTAVDLSNGEVVILGGRQEPNIDAPAPEIFSPTAGWRTLAGASSVPALGFPDGNWYYPKAFLTPSGKIFVLGNWTYTYSLTTTGDGSVTLLSSQAVPGNYQLPALMYAPGKVLSLRANKKVNLVNVSLKTPAITTTTDLDQVRYWANTTVMADGKVLVNGGSAVANELTGVAYTAQIWNPLDGKWTVGAAAGKPRLYHSIALLLPDGSVLTGAGGAPGPVNNLNMEIYYPPYLYRKNTSGLPASRPTLTSAPSLVHVGQTFTATVAANQTIGRVTMVRTGSVTHSFNPSQRFVPLTFVQSGQTLTITMPTDPDVALPGYYMMFVLKGGVPSVAKIVRVTT